MHDTEIVPAIRALLTEKIGSERFELWFASTHLSLANRMLTVEVPSKFNADWLRKHYRGTLETVAESLVGKTLSVEFRVNALLTSTGSNSSVQEKLRSPMHDDRAASRSTTSESTKQSGLAVLEESLQAALPIREITPAERDRTTHQVFSHVGDRCRQAPNTVEALPRRRFANLESFVVGPCNRLAHASAQTISERPGAFSPLFIYGPNGCGKTHLLEAIWTAARKQNHALNAVYLSAEQFTTLFLSALHGHGMPNFRRKYRAVELLLIDDLQFIAGKKATRIELLHTIDTLARAGKQLVFSANRPPAELTELGPELTTRLAAGMVCSIELPDARTRIGLAKNFAKRLDFALPCEIAELIATQIVGGPRELCGAVNRLHACANLLGRQIDRAFAEQTLAEMSNNSGKLIRLGDIDHAICDVFGLGKETLQSSRRSQHVSAPRMLAMFLARKLTRAGLNEIGQHFGGRSHSTVISAHKRVAEWISQHSEIELSGQRCKIEDAIRRVESRLRVG
jgi:chromosomal replication initiator protein